MGTRGPRGRSQRWGGKVGRPARDLLGQLHHMALTCINSHGRIVRGYRKT